VLPGCVILAADVPVDGVVVCGDRTSGKVSLTFDDGPDPVTTPPLLELLRDKGVPATFFLVGQRVEAYPDLVRRMRDEGHELADHSYHHVHLTSLGGDGIRDEWVSTRDAIERIGGRAPVLARPPWGYYDRRVVDAAREAGMATVVWDVITYDYLSPGTDAVLRKVLEARGGSIVLLHERTKRDWEQRAALETAVDTLRSRGLDFVTVGDLPRAPEECD